MKNTFSIMCFAALALSVNGGTFTNESPAGMKIIWAVPNNVWPLDSIWTYKVISQIFAPAVVSNLLTISSFNDKDKIQLPPEAAAIDKNALGFTNKEGTKHLSIVPVWGYIEYYDQNADAKATSAVKGVPEPVVGVPELPEATRLGLHYARLLGIDVSLFARKPHGNDFDLHWIVDTRGWTDPKTKKQMEEIHNFGISFTRCIDGFPVSGFGDFEVYFGNNAKVSRIIVSWHNLEPYELHTNLVTPEQVVKSIANGQTSLPQIPKFLMGEIKTLTITNATPCYSRSKFEDQPMDFVVPALRLDVLVGDGKTNMPIWFQTGIFSQTKP
jgi:hypothetical protein